MIKAFIFDLGNVLLPFSHDRMYAQVAALCGRDANMVRRAFAEDDLAARFERGAISDTNLQSELDRRLETHFERDALHRALGDIFNPDDEMLGLVDALRQRGFRLVLLSNTNSVHVRWIESRYSVFEKFDACVFSHEARAMKPEPAIYAEAIRRASFPPGECFYTDDIEAYVVAGRDAGLDAEVFTSAAAFRSQLLRRSIDLAVE
jgi:putative hydrolase of the HAD superfamily